MRIVLRWPGELLSEGGFDEGARGVTHRASHDQAFFPDSLHEHGAILLVHITRRHAACHSWLNPTIDRGQPCADRLQYVEFIAYDGDEAYAFQFEKSRRCHGSDEAYGG